MTGMDLNNISGGAITWATDCPALQLFKGGLNLTPG